MTKPLSKLLLTKDSDDALARLGEFVAGLDRTPDMLLVGSSIYEQLGCPATFNSIKVKEDRANQWLVTPMRLLMNHKEPSHEQNDPVQG